MPGNGLAVDRIGNSPPVGRGTAALTNGLAAVLPFRHFGGVDGDSPARSAPAAGLGLAGADRRPRVVSSPGETGRLADRAGLPAGAPITLSTANGPRAGQLVRGVPVRAGELVLNDASVSVGLSGMAPDQALLGQSFLKQFDVEIGRDAMVLRQRR